VKVLGLDTATSTASVAIVDDGRVIAETWGQAGAPHAELLVMIDAVCTGAGLGPRELDAIAVGAGPGSFTGLRIGMATAKGIAFAARCPLWAVSSLAALAYVELCAPDPRDGVVVGVLDARRGEVYAGAYRRDAGRVVAVGDERVLPPDQLATFATGPRVHFVGDALGAYPDALGALDATWARTPSGAAVAQLALAGSRVDVLVGGAPSYIRPSEAEIKYPEGVPGALRKR
jgi:tRNA threonylcarbamoyladenosine biosynthesis protein TsaB